MTNDERRQRALDETEWLDDELEELLNDDIAPFHEGLDLPEELLEIYATAPPSNLSRATYLRELLFLQRELIKLQDWVVHTGEKIAIIFEGRDSAGKGGAIKRISQRLNPRVARIVALNKPTERDRSQWYFQRYVPHLPSGGTVLSGCPGIRAHAGSFRYPGHQVLVLNH